MDYFFWLVLLGSLKFEFKNNEFRSERFFLDNRNFFGGSTFQKEKKKKKKISSHILLLKQTVDTNLKREVGAGVAFNTDVD